jgi:hypothetical protein
MLPVAEGLNIHPLQSPALTRQTIVAAWIFPGSIDKR